MLIAAIVAGAVMFAMSGGTGGSRPSAARPSGGLSAASGSTATESPTLDPSPMPSPILAPITATSSLAPGRGSLIFNDTFSDSHSGWPTSGPSVTTFKYAAGGYVIGSPGVAMEHMVYAPHQVDSGQISMSLTAVPNGAPTGAGFGVVCSQGTGAAKVAYAFTLRNDKRFYIERFDGVSGSSAGHSVVAFGRHKVVLGAKAVTVVGMCATLADGKTTRLVLYAAGSKLADTTDRATLAGPGWVGGIDLASGKTPSTLTATAWDERDLSR